MGADGTPTATGAGEWPTSYPSSYQTYEAYGLIPETEPATAAAQGLPPMSSLRPNGTPTTTTLTGPNTFGPANHAEGVVNKALGGVSSHFFLLVIKFAYSVKLLKKIMEQYMFVWNVLIQMKLKTILKF